MIAFSYPWALLLALPAAWLLWRSRRKTVERHEVANLFLWLDAPADDSARRDNRRATPPWIAWLQAAILALLAVALARPYTAGSMPNAALVVDRSLSMSARDGNSTRIELARSAAKAWLASQPPRNLVQLIGAATAPSAGVVARAGSAEAVSAINGLTTVDTPADIAAAVELAHSLTTGEVAVISDLPAPPDAATRSVTWHQVGGPADNVAITAMAATADGGAVIEVTNFGNARRAVTIDVTGGAVPWRERVDLPASSSRSFLLAPGSARTLSAQLTTDPSGNAISGDDRRQIEVRPARLRIRFAGGDQKLRAALEALPDASVFGTAAEADVLVANGPATPSEIPSLTFTSGGTDPGISRNEINGVRRIDVAIDMAGSTWPLTPAFPIFIAESIEWLTRRAVPSLTATDIAGFSESDARNTVAPRLSELRPAPPAPPRALFVVVLLIALAGAAVELALRRRALIARAVATAMLVVAAAGIPFPFGGSARAVAIALDTSASVSGNQQKAADRIRRETELARSGDQTDTIRFGGAESDIAAALRTARASLPTAGDRRIVLISDGQQTTGDVLAEARNAAAAGVPIDVVAIDSRTPAFVQKIDVPATARTGATIPVRVSINGSPREILRLTLSRDGLELDSKRVVLNDAGSALVAVADTAGAPGIMSYRAVLTDERLGLDVSEGGAAIAITGRGRILVVSEGPSSFAALISGAPVDAVVTEPKVAPASRQALAGFSAIVIDDVAPHKLTARQLDAIAEAVSVDGAGLLFLGSKDSLDASDFGASAFAESLPIDFTALPNPAPKSSALALLVDISGSMATASDGVTKISAARDAIARTLAVIPGSDAVEVIGFAAQPTVLIGTDSPRDAAAVSDKLKAIVPSGTTALAPAVVQAVEWLKRTGRERKRLLLVTDGKTSVSDAESTGAAVRGQSVEVSVVTIGSDAEREWLAELAAATGGRSYFPSRVTDLSREVAREAARGATGREVNETFTVRGGAHPLAPGEPAPRLNGYIAGRLRAGAVAAWKSHADDAVLAAWPRGLGRVTVFAGDLGGSWSASLQSWPARTRFWHRALEWTARATETTAIDAELIVTADGPRVIADVGELPASSGARTLPVVTATLAGPSGQSTMIPLHAVSPTRFEGPASLSEAGDYRVTISAMNPADGSESRLTRGWYWTGDRESQSRGINLPLLDEIARTSSGRMLPPLNATPVEGEAMFDGPRRRRPVNAAPWLVFAALALLSVDYIRRASRTS